MEITKMTKTNIYFAAPLFSEPDRDYNMKVVGKIREAYGDRVEIYNPMENDAINDKTAYASSQQIASADYAELNKADIVIALTDGASTDVGVALEVGIAYEKGLKIIGLYTDVRQQGADNQQKVDALSIIGENQFSYVNLMLTGVIKEQGYLVASTDELMMALALYIG